MKVRVAAMAAIFLSAVPSVFAGTVVTTPEPGTVGMLAAGIAGLGIAAFLKARRKK
jgi:hypothetical protein